MGFFDFIDDIKAKNGKKKAIVEIRKSAEGYVRDGKALYDRAYSEVTSYACDTNYKIEEHLSFKRNIIKELTSEINSVFVSFQNFNIDRLIYEEPNVRNSTNDFDFVGNLTSSSVVGTLPTIKLLFDLFSDPEEEYYQAKNQLSEAKYYYQQMKYEKERLRLLKDKMRAIRDVISEERIIIKSMVSNIRKISDKLNEAMTKNKVSKAEAEYFKKIHRIGLLIKESISVQFLKENYTINSQYIKLINQMKEIDSKLSVAPSITSGGNVLKEIFEVLDNVILE